ncbi:hypothetical protein JQU01_16525 [Ponticoccus sp. SC2-67]|nr:hypothetical protein [Ponticoccus sp. SC6-9]MBM1226109.1 hypothetical protein [Ponticoccus sp. SC6-15]MBM1235454.1 hypothetical protein [Ponticoccus sp. SC6-45]MBM1239727.1 hypothetical protein [Ponticoccus sp. SC6-49]MBM1243871.1 hypothetical protein [Ponticoccus sp. SC2-64]MBM1253382.1 hypothetical protein [Ponticoccus sp. SC6-33]MBM1262457.1 hypothetical protein [Ponticoccus sp. SC6-31]MBM1266806.1 hypothetical protein [Ponticoccus sp. SC2-67]MBM1271369.1 hypothetical protein [Pontico
MVPAIGDDQKNAKARLFLGLGAIPIRAKAPKKPLESCASDRDMREAQIVVAPPIAQLVRHVGNKRFRDGSCGQTGCAQDPDLVEKGVLIRCEAGGRKTIDDRIERNLSRNALFRAIAVQLRHQRRHGLHSGSVRT